MIRFFMLFAMITVLTTSLMLSQDSINVSPWKNGATLGMSFNQVTLSNWTGGGKSTVAVTGAVGLFANYTGDASDWSNSLEAGYGLTKLGDLDFRKSDDKLIVISKYSYKAGHNLSYSALLDFRTQFNYGYNFDQVDSNNNYPKISGFMAPAFLNVGLGLNYRPLEYLQIMVSPIANRIIMVLDDDLANAGAFGVDKGKYFKSELGAAFNANFKKEVFKNVVLQTRLNLFSAFSFFPSTVVNWETIVNMKINSFLNASLAADLIYDEKVKMLRDNGTTGPATQFRNVLALGFSYVIK